MGPESSVRQCVAITDKLFQNTKSYTSSSTLCAQDQETGKRKSELDRERVYVRVRVRARERRRERALESEIERHRAREREREGGKEGGVLFLLHNHTELGYGIANYETTHFLGDSPRARGVYGEG